MTIRNFHERNEWLGTHAERLTVTPEDGAIWTEDDTDTIWQYYAAAWHAVGGGGGGGGHIIADAGVPFPPEPVLNFIGAGVSTADNAGVSTDVTIPGGGHTIADEGAPLAAEPVLNFIGAAVSAVDNAGVSTDVTIVLTKQIVFKLENTLYIATGGLRLTNTLGITLNIQEVEISVGTAPTGASITVDVHNNGVTIFTNQAHRPVITATNYQGTTILIDVPAWADGDYLTMDIDGVGSTIAGANLVCTIRAVSG